MFVLDKSWQGEKAGVLFACAGRRLVVYIYKDRSLIALSLVCVHGGGSGYGLDGSGSKGLG